MKAESLRKTQMNMAEGQKSRGRFPFSPVAFGIAFVIPFNTALEMFLGSFLFWFMSRKPKAKRSLGYQIFLDNKETIGAGIIAGGSLIGIALLIIETSL